MAPSTMTASFRAVLFRMVPKQPLYCFRALVSFRAVLFRMVPKQYFLREMELNCFRAVLFRMVPKQSDTKGGYVMQF